MKRLLTFLLLFIIFLRIVFEGAGYGNFIVLSIYFLFPLVLFDNRNFLISHRFILFSFFVFVIFSYSFFNSLSITSNYLALISGIFRYTSYFLVAFMFKRGQINFKSYFNFYLFLVFIEFLVFSYQNGVGMDRPSGTMYSRNHLGVFLIPGFFISLIFLKKYLIAIFFILFLIYLGGIGNILALVFGFIFYILSVKKRIFSALLFIFFVCVTFSFIFYERIFELVDNFQFISAKLDSGVVGGADSFTWRLISWNNLLSEAINEKKVLFGFGLETTSSPSINIFGFQPHNDYIKVLIEVGFVGLIVLLPMLWIVFKKLSTHNLYELSIRISLVSIMVSMLSNNILLHVSFWWIFIGFLNFKRI